jgi:tetratricopeptide (TPR) repeat protein
MESVTMAGLGVNTKTISQYHGMTPPSAALSSCNKMIVMMKTKFHFIIMIALLFFNFTVGSHGQDADETLVDEHYKALIAEGKPSQAYEYVSKGEDEFSLIYAAEHLINGYGVSRDECQAVLLLEKAYALNPTGLARNYLHHVYDGAWSYRASMEQSVWAAYELGMFYYKLAQQYAEMKSIYLALLKTDSNFYYVQAYKYWLLAKKLKHPEAENYLAKILLKYPELKNKDFTYETDDMKCPVRGKSTHTWEDD